MHFNKAGDIEFDEESVKVGNLTLFVHSGIISFDYENADDGCFSSFWKFNGYGEAKLRIEIAEDTFLDISVPADQLVKHLDRAEVEELIIQKEFGSW